MTARAFTLTWDASTKMLADYVPTAITDVGAECVFIQPSDCDCNGNQIDVLGVCGGDCESDENGNGVCDADENLNAYCGWGTYWNEDSAACVLLIPPFDGEFGDYSSLNPCATLIWTCLERWAPAIC